MNRNSERGEGEVAGAIICGALALVAWVFVKPALELVVEQARAERIAAEAARTAAQADLRVARALAEIAERDSVTVNAAARLWIAQPVIFVALLIALCTTLAILTVMVLRERQRT